MITLNTEQFKDALTRAIKGAGLDKLIPITSMIAIKVENNQLTLITTDASNTLYITQEVNASTFYAVVYVEQLYKLITRITTDVVKLDVKDSVLTVKANGDYKLALPLDENGNAIVFPEDDNTFINTVKPDSDISPATIKQILATNKSSLAVVTPGKNSKDDSTCYTHYYVGDSVITTDREQLCRLDVSVFDDAKLISAQTMELLDVMRGDKIDIYITDDALVFATKDCTVVAHEAEGLDEFDIESITAFLDEEFTSSCEVSKSALVSLLERISLFVGPYDNNAITLTFTKTGLEVSSAQSDGVEIIEYSASHDFKPYTCQVSVERLLSVVKANASDTVQIQYANEQSLKIVEEKVTQVLALMK